MGTLELAYLACLDCKELKRSDKNKYLRIKEVLTSLDDTVSAPSVPGDDVKARELLELRPCYFCSREDNGSRKTIVELLNGYLAKDSDEEQI